MKIEIVTLIGWILTSIGLIFNAIQVKIANSQRKTQIDNTQRENALKMSEYFLQLLQKEFVNVKRILTNTDVPELYKKLKYTDLEYFDVGEMTEKLCLQGSELAYKYGKYITENYDKLWEVFKNQCTDIDTNYYTFYGEIYCECKWDEKKLEKYIKKHMCDLSVFEKKRVCKGMTLLKKKLSIFYTSQSNDLLNKLEYFAMHFTCNIADDTVVYQSLHQCYLSAVKLMYGRIVLLNDTSSNDKYYINIIKLYNRWAKMDDMSHKIHLENERKNIIEPYYPKFDRLK